MLKISFLKNFDYINCYLSSCKFLFQIKFDRNSSILSFVLPFKFTNHGSLRSFPDIERVLVWILNVLFTTNQVGFSGTPLKRRNAWTVNFEHDLLFSDIDYVDAIFIDYGEEAARQWRELSNFCCWILREVLLTNELLYLLIDVGAVKTIEEWTLVSERYKLQLREGLMLLVLIG